MLHLIVPLVGLAIAQSEPVSPVEQPPTEQQPSAEELSPEMRDAVEYEEWRNRLFEEPAPETPVVKPPSQPKKRFPRAIAFSAGVGLASASETPADNTATGFSGEVEYIWRITRWLKPSVYFGGLFTGTGSCTDEGRDITPCDVQHILVYTGAQGHLMIPIPYVGPFFEVGLGLGAGGINRVVGDGPNERTVGAFPHFRVGFGLAFGKHHNVELGLGFMGNFSAQTYSGRFALGLELPLGS